MSFIYMKILESRPHRYDFAMHLFTLGELSRLKRHIASFVRSKEEVLELGCGTGTLARMLLEKGAEVTGIDSNTGMLEVARVNAPRARYLPLDLAQLDEHFDDESFDLIVSTLVFSELDGIERQFVLRQIRRLLRRGGRVLIADEVVPRPFLPKVIYYLMRPPLALITWIVTQNATRALPADMESEFEAAGLRVTGSKPFFLGMLRLFEVKR